MPRSMPTLSSRFSVPSGMAAGAAKRRPGTTPTGLPPTSVPNTSPSVSEASPEEAPPKAVFLLDVVVGPVLTEQNDFLSFEGTVGP